MKNTTIKAIIFILNCIYSSTIVFLYVKKIIGHELLTAMLFFQFLVMGLLMFNYFMYIKFRKLSRVLKFHYVSGFFEQPRMEGIYKKNWFQIHFKQMERGEVTGMLRTYVKLQWKDEKKFNLTKLRKYTNYSYEGEKILSVEHITRPYKNYLLLRRVWFTFDKNKLYSFMDLLLKVAKEAEIK